MAAAHPDPFSLTLDELRRRTSQKWRYYPAEAIPAWIAEMDVIPAEAVIDAVTHAMTTGDTGYSMSGGYLAAMADFARDRWDWEFDPSEGTGVADVMSGIGALIRSLTEPGERIAISPPVYPPFFEVIATNDRQVVEAPLTEDGRLDPSTIERAFRSGARVYLLCNPHNPTGVVHRRDELAELAELAADHGVRVLSDEIHAPLVYSRATFVPYLTVPGTQSAFSILSASKGWNLAGLKAAMVIPGAEGVDVVRSWPHLVTDGATHIGVIAQTAALRDGRDWLDAVVAAITRRADELADLVRDRLPGVGYRIPEATFLAWLDLGGRGMGDDPAAVILRRGRVALTSGTWFGDAGRGFVRLNMGTSAEILGAIVDGIAAATAGETTPPSPAADLR